MTDDDLKEAGDRANLWIHVLGEPAVTRETALNEEHLALDVVELIAEVKRLRADLGKVKARESFVTAAHNEEANAVDRMRPVYDAAKAWLYADDHDAPDPAVTSDHLLILAIERAEIAEAKGKR